MHIDNTGQQGHSDGQSSRGEENNLDARSGETDGSVPSPIHLRYRQRVREDWRREVDGVWHRHSWLDECFAPPVDHRLLKAFAEDMASSTCHLGAHIAVRVSYLIAHYKSWALAWADYRPEDNS